VLELHQDACGDLDAQLVMQHSRSLLCGGAGAEAQVGVGDSSGCPGAEDAGDLLVVAGEGTGRGRVEVDRAHDLRVGHDGEGERAGDPGSRRGLCEQLPIALSEETVGSALEHPLGLDPFHARPAVEVLDPVERRDLLVGGDEGERHAVLARGEAEAHTLRYDGPHLPRHVRESLEQVDLERPELLDHLEGLGDRFHTRRLSTSTTGRHPATGDASVAVARETS
jgi:hypothetical protein